jgi:glycosyltransferase involved in cell wall biosynthesis
MSEELSVLSVYEAFFSGGARILHSSVLTALHRRGQRHSVLALQEQVYREGMLQRMQDDACYRGLVASGVAVSALREGVIGATPFSESELSAAALELSLADVVFTLKEQPLRLINQIGLPDRPVITCLHRSDPENQGAALAELHSAVAAGRIAALICCAESTKVAYQAQGIPAGLLKVIPNGVDLRRFRPDRAVRAAARGMLGVADDAPVVMLAARYDPMKNIPLFLAAAAVFLRRCPTAHVVMCGAGMSVDNADLRRDLAVAGLEGLGRVHLLGVRSDPEKFYAAADVVALTSAFGEAAPLCLIEGMMCGAVPVATDVGDSAAIVAGHGLISEPDAGAVAAAWVEAAARRRELAPALLASRGRFGRSRMIASYDRVVRRAARSAVGGGGVVVRRPLVNG